jgi:Caudovirus prohead serine protease
MRPATAFRDFPWRPKETLHRFADVDSYDADAHSCLAVLASGARILRPYGVEVLSIMPSAVDLGRAKSGLLPLIDSHQVQGIANVLGRVDDVTFEQGKLVGRLVFDDSDAGRNAEGMIARRMLRGISVGYQVTSWTVSDDDGNVVDPERERLSWDATYTFTATRWALLECSLVAVPADPSTTIRSGRIQEEHPDLPSLIASRSFGASASIGEDGAAEILQRMRARQRAALTSSDSVTIHRRRPVYPGQFWRGERG